MTRLVAIALFAGVAAAGPKPKPSVVWAPSWDAAVDTARALNVPIVVHRHGFY